MDPVDSTCPSHELRTKAMVGYMRPFTAKHINQTMREVGVKRAGNGVGERVFDNDAILFVFPVVKKAIHIAQATGYRTVNACHIEMAYREIYGIQDTDLPINDVATQLAKMAHELQAAVV
jgi:hypothetical protein